MMFSSTTFVRSLVLAMASAAVLTGAGCSDPENNRPSATQPVIRYQSLGLRAVPDYLKGTVYEMSNLQDTKPFLVSGFGLVVRLRGTGDNSAIPAPVRDYLIKEMLRHGFGGHRIQGYENMGPESIMRDPTTAVVRADGYVPPGARKDDHFDVLVSALEESNTTSLANGQIYQTELKYLGGDENRPTSSVNVYAKVWGPVFVNPAYSLLNPVKLQEASAKQSLRYGIVMDGGVSDFDNPLVLRVREPQFSTARSIERAINRRFQGVADKTNQLGELAMAAAQNEAFVNVYVPKVYRGNWEHFAGVVKHLYVNSSPGSLALMAEKLAQAAVQPDARLENISLALEGIGQPAEGVLLKLIKNPSPEVGFAAARALAYIGDATGEARDYLMKIAGTPNHDFRLEAVKVLTDLPDSGETSQYLRQLVNSDNTLVRIEAYRALARNNDPLVFTKVVHEKFVLDIVPSSGRPFIYATRRGVPRLAIFGARQNVRTPTIFSALDSRLTVSADKSGGPIKLFYRSLRSQGDPIDQNIMQVSRADLADVIARLGGEASGVEERFSFSYSDVIALLQQMNTSGKLVATGIDGREQPIILTVEDQVIPGVADQAIDAPRIPDMGRPQDSGSNAQPPVIPDTLRPTSNPTSTPTKKEETPAGGRRRGN